MQAIMHTILILNLIIEATNFIKKVYTIIKKIFKYKNYRSQFSCIIYVFPRLLRTTAGQGTILPLQAVNLGLQNVIENLLHPKLC